ncbi:MAG: succinate dehydrogenase assembly factor 2 [Pseudomonadota bacterium]
MGSEFMDYTAGQTGMTRSSDGLDKRRKRLLFRSWHRGIREMDLVLGSFADANIGELSEEELVAYETLLEVPDPELFKWISGSQPVPPNHDTPMYRKVAQFRHSLKF